jgi:hypothetical protein
MRLSQRFCRFFKCILEVVFYDGVQHPCNSASISSILSKWRLVLSSFGVTDKSKVGGDDSYVVLGQKFPGEK